MTKRSSGRDPLPGRALLTGCAALMLTLTIPGGCRLASRPSDGSRSFGLAIAGKRKAKGPADNSACLVCHMDFAAELISARHAKKGYGCDFCHGESAAHGDDELNITPPDRLFGRAEIESFCKRCHWRHPSGKEYDEFLKKWQGKRRPNGRLIMPGSVCTDCHGNHAVLRPDQMSQVPAESG